jgi:hypothetical protein
MVRIPLRVQSCRCKRTTTPNASRREQFAHESAAFSHTGDNVL